MKSLCIAGLFSTSLLLTGCDEEEALRNQVATLNAQVNNLNTQVTALGTRIDNCKTGAQMQYDANLSSTALLSFSKYLGEGREEYAEHKRGEYLWKCLQTADAKS